MSRKGQPTAHICVLNRLRQGNGNWVRHYDLTTALWTDIGLKEPVESQNYIRKQIVRLRNLGHVIRAQYGYGYRLIREAP